MRFASTRAGNVGTPMHDAATVERLASASLLGRVGTPEDVANVVAMLASAGGGSRDGRGGPGRRGHALRIAH